MEKIKTPKMKGCLRLHLWFETQEGIAFGLGRLQILQKVKETGSLNKAAKELGMSYRAAWGRIKRTEEVLNIEVLTKIEGQKSLGLSEYGVKLVDAFENWMQEVEAYALESATKYFNWESLSYTERKSKKKVL